MYQTVGLSLLTPSDQKWLNKGISAGRNDSYMKFKSLKINTLEQYEKDTIFHLMTYIVNSCFPARKLPFQNIFTCEHFCVSLFAINPYLYLQIRSIQIYLYSNQNCPSRLSNLYRE